MPIFTVEVTLTGSWKHGGAEQDKMSMWMSTCLNFSPSYAFISCKILDVSSFTLRHSKWSHEVVWKDKIPVGAELITAHTHASCDDGSKVQQREVLTISSGNFWIFATIMNAVHIVSIIKPVLSSLCPRRFWKCNDFWTTNKRNIGFSIPSCVLGSVQNWIVVYISLLWNSICWTAGGEFWQGVRGWGLVMTSLFQKKKRKKKYPGYITHSALLSEHRNHQARSQHGFVTTTLIISDHLFTNNKESPRSASSLFFFFFYTTVLMLWCTVCACLLACVRVCVQDACVWGCGNFTAWHGLLHTSRSDGW